MIDITGLREDKRPQSSTIVHALLDRLEAAEKAVTEAYRRGYATGQEEIAAERDALRARIELLERQEPVAAQHRFRHPQKTEPNWSIWQPCAISKQPAWTIDSQGYEVEYKQLYALPGAKGEDK